MIILFSVDADAYDIHVASAQDFVCFIYLHTEGYAMDYGGHGIEPIKKIRNQTQTQRERERESSEKMSCPFNLHFPKALPPLSSSSRCGTSTSFFVACQHKPSSHSTNPAQQAYPRSLLFCQQFWTLSSSSQKPNESISLQKPSLALQIGALLALAEQPACAVTGVNNEPELSWVLIQLGIVLFGYFIVMPPIILNWLRIRWYRRNLLEMFVQFMFVFLFFPGVLLWAPFLNFRKFPRDPSLKYPWSTPEDPSKIRNAYPKYPFAEPEDYQ